MQRFGIDLCKITIMPLIIFRFLIQVDLPGCFFCFCPFQAFTQQKQKFKNKYIVFLLNLFFVIYSFKYFYKINIIHLNIILYYF